LKDGMKVLVIGVDAATPDLLMKWAEEGKLPTFSKLIKNGASGKLRSTIPPTTAPAWLSFVTGKNPGKLGIFDFVEREPNTYRTKLVNFQSTHCKSIWEILSDKGKKVGVFNVPTTFPPKKVNGFIVSGWPIPQGAVFTYPGDLQQKLGLFVGVQEGPERTIAMATWMWFAGDDDCLKGLYRFTEREVKATQYLMNSYEWDFFMTVFTCMDPIQHFFWKYTDPEHPLYDPEKGEKYGNEILKFYQKVDEILKELLNIVGEDTTIIIMSDHGAGPLYNLFNVNDWLRRKGFLERTRKKTNRFLNLSSLIKLLFRRVLDRVTNLIYVLGLLKVYYFVTDHSYYLRTLDKTLRAFTGIMPSVRRSLQEMDIEWSKTKAYSFGSGNVGRIYLNVKGREPQGIVEPGQEYEELRNQLIKELRKLADPTTGRSMDITVFRKEEIYHGEYVHQAPDIVLYMNELLTEFDPSLGHDSFFSYDFSSKRSNAGHRMDGILILKGPRFRKGLKIGQAEIIDGAPTILYLMGCPIPDDMDGKVLTSAFNPSYLESNPIKYEKVIEKAAPREHKWSKEEEKAIKERLKALGYLQ